MKKLLVLAITFASLSPCFAQPEAGDLIIGGAFRIAVDGQKDKAPNGDAIKRYRNFAFRFGPRAHYMLNEHMSIGGEIFFDVTKQTTFGDSLLFGFDDDLKIKDKSFGFGIGPLYRYWWQIGEKKKFGLFAEAGLGFSTGKTTDEQLIPGIFGEPFIVSTVTRRNSLYLHAAPGMYYAPAKCFFFELTFGGFGLWYSLDVYKNDETEAKSKYNNFDIGGDLQELFLTDTAIGFNLIF